MSIHRRSAPSGVSPDEEQRKPAAPKEKPGQDSVADEQRDLDEMRPPKRSR